MALMKCPGCGGETRVVASRLAPGSAVRRHRVCVDCDETFTTYERHARLEARPTQPRELLRVSEVARQLGLSRTVAYEMVRRGAIPSIRYNSRLWVDPDWVDSQVSARREAIAMRPEAV